MKEKVTAMIAKGNDGVYFYGFAFVVANNKKSGDVLSKFVLLGHDNYLKHLLPEQRCF
jgi:hypothetical protein